VRALPASRRRLMEIDSVEVVVIEASAVDAALSD
jgi:hypothetical protein